MAPQRTFGKGDVSFPGRSSDDSTCPSCSHKGLEVFYDVPSVPVNSVLLLPTRQEALAFPRGKLRLGFCPACGFVSNVLYDESAVEYSQRCEESQACSGTFNAFADHLTTELIAAHDLHEKTVLEVGCGKGDFLVLLCRRGPNNGIGIDPGVVPGRIPGDVRHRIELIQDYLTDEPLNVTADFVCCRHTFEHVKDVGRFLDLQLPLLRQGDDKALFIEVPDVLRVLEEGAFWDLYHEHCSYFSPGSLARLCASRRLRISQLALEFRGQYILLTGHRGGDGTTGELPFANDLSVVDAAVSAFADVCGERIRYWTTFIEEAAARREGVVVWGGSSKGVTFLNTLGVEREVAYVVDINPHMQGRFVPGTGQRVVSPSLLREVRPKHVIVMNPIYSSEIAAELARQGVDAQVHCV